MDSFGSLLSDKNRISRLSKLLGRTMGHVFCYIQNGGTNCPAKIWRMLRLATPHNVTYNIISYIVLYELYCSYTINSSIIKVLSVVIKRQLCLTERDVDVVCNTVLQILRTACACGKSDLNTLQLVKIFWRLGWLKGKSIGNHRFSHEIWDFPVIVPLNQSIDFFGDWVANEILSCGIDLWWYTGIPPNGTFKGKHARFCIIFIPWCTLFSDKTTPCVV